MPARKLLILKDNHCGMPSAACPAMTEDMRNHLTTAANLYGALAHSPLDRHVRHCYDALKRELWSQFEALPMRVQFTDVDPYASSADMFAELDACGALRVFTLASLPSAHPFAELAPNGQSFNSVFRAVHDGLAHYPIRAGFGPAGELSAFRRHYAMLSRNAGKAIATETLAQNAWFNFGPFAHMPAKSRPFAEQKACLLSDAIIGLCLED